MSLVKIKIQNEDLYEIFYPDVIIAEIMGHYKFIRYILDDSKKITGIEINIDLGHGYDFNKGVEKVILKFGDSYTFDYGYTDTTEGTWENKSHRITISLIEIEE